MIKEMLQLENVQISEGVADWKEAIHLSLKQLVLGGYVTEEYEKAIIKCTKEYGPYYILADEFALIHGRPEEGVIEQQLAVTLLKKPVKFEESDQKVRLMIALAAKDADSHIDVMKVIATILQDEKKLKEILQAENEEQIYRMLTQIETVL